MTFILSSAAPVDNMKRILCSDWLAERARWVYLARWGLAALIARKKKIAWSKLTKFCNSWTMSAIKSQKVAENRQTKENITTLVGIILYYIFHGEFASD